MGFGSRVLRPDQGQPKQIAAALWGNSAAQYRYKHVIVVEEDIDPANCKTYFSNIARR